MFPALVYQGISICRRAGVHTRKPYRVPAVTRLSSLCEAKPCLISELRFGCVTQPNLYFFYAHGATRKLRTLEPDRRSQPWYVISTGQFISLFEAPEIPLRVIGRIPLQSFALVFRGRLRVRSLSTPCKHRRTTILSCLPLSHTRCKSVDPRGLLLHNRHRNLHSSNHLLQFVHLQSLKPVISYRKYGTECRAHPEKS